ncbi:MAG: NAD(P)-dependent oxidoreductase [Caldilineaceae bacterium]|nr:NAD(P)-dependent oxidoreductase [Caldilineaceae bacterium]
MSSSRSVAVTGGLGNLGTKLLQHLARTSPCQLLIGLDVRAPSSDQLQALHDAASQNTTGSTPAVELLECDLTDPHDARWRDALDRVQAVVHFAALNPYPDASWDEAAISIDMTLNVALAAAGSPGVERFVFATSNHVMGRYKDDPLAAAVGPGTLTPESPLGVGTVWAETDPPLDATAYSTTKMVGERICKALGAQSNGATTFVNVRIGWCQPGPNRPETLSATGDPSVQIGGAESHPDPEGYRRAERWFRLMWLSNRDFVHLFERAVNADAGAWPAPAIVVNGMSDNTGMTWSLDETRRYLGYQPSDDVNASSS